MLVDSLIVKTCTYCGEEKPISDFYYNAPYQYYSLICKDCTSIKGKKYRANNKDTHRNYHLKKKYNITLEQYNNLLINQKGKCAICGTHQKDLIQELSVDHDHETGKIRGLLCQKCNIAIGLLEDNLELIKTVFLYIKNSKTT